MCPLERADAPPHAGSLNGRYLKPRKRAKYLLSFDVAYSTVEIKDHAFLKVDHEVFSRFKIMVFAITIVQALIGSIVIENIQAS